MKPDRASRVSPIMKASVAFGLIGAVVLVWYLRRGDGEAASVPADRSTAGPSQPGTPGTRAPTHVQRVSPVERQRLAAQIRDARARRPPATSPAPQAPSLPTPAAPTSSTTPSLSASDPEPFKTTMRAAMREVIPMLAECYDTHGSGVPDEIKVVAKLALTSDPDVGTLIDTHGLADDKDAALPADFDLCLRDTLAGLQLPALSEGEEVAVTYPFLFTR